MPEEKLLTIREVSLILGINENEVIDLAESGKLAAYKVGGVFLRFKREGVEEFKKIFRPSPHKDQAYPKYSWKEKISDFLYFNDFYILSFLIIILVLVIIFQGY